MKKYFFEVADIFAIDLKAAHVIVEEVVDVIDVDEEVVQLVDVAEEVVQELIDWTEESTVVLYLSSHDAASWNRYSPDAFRNQDLSYLRVVFDCLSSC